MVRSSNCGAGPGSIVRGADEIGGRDEAEVKLNYEVHFQNFIYLLFSLMGFYTNVEYHTAKGRVDLIVKTDKYIYIMEFKRDSSAQTAMQQIKDKDYAKPFKREGRKIVLIGANFASDMSALDGVLVEEG